MLGTVALYFRQPRSPLGRDFELMGRLAALAAIAIERKRSEEALRHSEAQYRSLFENVIEGVYRSTVKGRFEAVNPALAHMLGHDTVDDLLTVMDMATLFTDSNERDHLISTLHRDGVVREAECQLRRRDGTQVTVLINARVIRGEESAITGYEGTITDITVRKRANCSFTKRRRRHRSRCSRSAMRSSRPMPMAASST
jgi:PAS domain S-box-containing protein